MTTVNNLSQGGYTKELFDQTFLNASECLGNRWEKFEAELKAPSDKLSKIFILAFNDFLATTAAVELLSFAENKKSFTKKLIILSAGVTRVALNLLLPVIELATFPISTFLLYSLYKRTYSKENDMEPSSFELEDWPQEKL